MKYLLIALTAMLFSQNAFSGDAGYMSSTCVSGTKRTVLTIFNDYTNESYIYTLIIDGKPVVYDLSAPGMSEVGDDGYMTIEKNGVPVLAINGPEKSITVYKDPRVGSIAMNNATPTPIEVKVTCTDYWPNP